MSMRILPDLVAAGWERSAPPNDHWKVFVYDLPPRFTSWLGAMRRGDWTRDHWYGVDVIMHKQLLHSPYRTHAPETADFFFVPVARLDLSDWTLTRP